ncbi:MAG: hypothetical protein J6A88_04800 [Oscillospiraceae bacterium]|nr:hypothetical protein [Oscillospiraceae bacterium]
MERLNEQRPTRGLSAAALRGWGYLFLLLGVVARAVIQNGMLNLRGVTGQQLLEALQGSNETMVLATVSLIMQALEACAVPIFAFLLVEGFFHTSNFAKYLGRVALVALVSEIPYNLAMGGGFFVTSTRNPVFALVLGLILLWFYRYYGEKSAKNIFINIIVTLAAILWCGMLRIEHGTFTIVLIATAWFMHGKPMRTMVCAIMSALGVVFSMLYLTAPISALTIHFYNEEKGESNRVFNLLCYPVMLLVAYFATFLI